MTLPPRRAVDKNKIATTERTGRHVEPPRPPRCAFFLGGIGAAAHRPRFCAAPAEPGSAYCARHHARCAVRPDSVEGARAIRRLKREATRAAAPPPEMAHLSSVAIAELDSADEPADIAACLDIAFARDDDGE